jgi:predicted ribosome quality control (RQC) complex YloA/Tae2 family protein
MLRNYYYLNRTIVELNNVLQNAEVTEIYSQEKNSLLLSIPTDIKPFRHLLISTNPLLPFLVIKDDHRKAKKNILQLEVLYKIEHIQKIEISSNDRLVRIVLGSLELVFSIMGGRTNIYFVKNGDVIDELRKSKGDNNILERLSQSEFTSEFVYHQIEEDVFDGFDIKKIKKEFSFIPKEIISEMKFRHVNGEKRAELFKVVLKELYTKKIKVFEHQFEEKIRFTPETFKIFKSENELFFDNCNSAIQKFLQKHYQFERINRFQKEISRQLLKELERTFSKLNNLKGRIEKGERSDEYYNYGNQLLASRYLLKRGMKEVTLVDYTSGNEITIKLNAKNTPQESIDNYFEKAKDEKINFKISEQLFKNTQVKYNNLKEIEREFQNAISVDDYSVIKAKLKISDKKNEKKKVINDAKLREYLVDSKYKVLVGRDSKSNDMLSIKIAKQNDYWFHARGLPGSHVVLRVEDTKIGIPKNILKNVAQIAAFYSKAKTAGTAPVSYTLAKFVRKKKGMEPGKVLIEKEKVLLVRPGIPENTVLITDD